ncbi:MAG: N-acetyl-gamma-glutamyl-phosphate reductase [Desulfobacterales bacterium]|jgi:N-acetyl-gamma-glutamyl-phosphate reductase
MNRVAVVGATGYAGAELVRILSGHSKTELTILTSRQYAGVRFDRVYPAMAGRIDLVCEEYSTDRLCNHADIVFMALPHQLPMKLVPEIIKCGLKVIDLSADFRFNDAALYESTYQPHASKELLKSSVYGLSEIYMDQIRTAKLIGNPGCYPTSVLLPLVPLVKKGILDAGTLVVDSKSGVSGAGRSLSQATHYSEVNESFKAYNVAAHRHNPEIDSILSREAQSPISITFVPHLVPMTRGMLTTIYAAPMGTTKVQDVIDSYLSVYSEKPFVRLSPKDGLPDTLHVRGTNYCDIGVKLDDRNNRLIIISAIDNLVKGAAGQAVQNMNIMLGIDETEGLLPVPYPL